MRVEELNGVSIPRKFNSFQFSESYIKTCIYIGHGIYLIGDNIGIVSSFIFETKNKIETPKKLSTIKVGHSQISVCHQLNKEHFLIADQSGTITVMKVELDKISGIMEIKNSSKVSDSGINCCAEIQEGFFILGDNLGYLTIIEIAFENDYPDIKKISSVNICESKILHCIYCYDNYCVIGNKNGNIILTEITGKYKLTLKMLYKVSLVDSYTTALFRDDKDKFIIVGDDDGCLELKKIDSQKGKVIIQHISQATVTNSSIKTIIKDRKGFYIVGDRLGNVIFVSISYKNDILVPKVINSTKLSSDWITTCVY